MIAWLIKYPGRDSHVFSWVWDLITDYFALELLLILLLNIHLFCLFKTFFILLVKYVSYHKKVKTQFWPRDHAEKLVAWVIVSVTAIWLSAKEKQVFPGPSVLLKYLQRKVLNCNCQSIYHRCENAKSWKMLLAKHNGVCVVVVLIWILFLRGRAQHFSVQRMMGKSDTSLLLGDLWY